MKISTQVCLSLSWSFASMYVFEKEFMRSHFKKKKKSRDPIYYEGETWKYQNWLSITLHLTLTNFSAGKQICLNFSKTTSKTKDLESILIIEQRVWAEESKVRHSQNIWYRSPLPFSICTFLSWSVTTCETNNPKYFLAIFRTFCSHCKTSMKTDVDENMLLRIK